MKLPGGIRRLGSVRPRWWILAAGVAAVALLLGGREKPGEHFAKIDVDPETTPTMFTRDAESLVSDSGYTRYLIKAPVWYVYDEAAEPNWKFDSGLYLEKYDNRMAVVATFVCDSAVYLTSPRLWEFIGNVRMRNESGDRFLTQHMYWNSFERKIYSDSFVHIEKSDRIIEGYGFITDENISEYEVRRPTMIIPVSDFNRDHRDDPGAEPSEEEADGDEPADAGIGQRQSTPIRASQRQPVEGVEVVRLKQVQ